MKIAMKDIRGLLQDGRIFVGRGTSSLNYTGLGLLEKSMVTIQPGIEIEPYTTYWGMSGSTLVSMGAFSYTHSVLSTLVKVGRYCSIAKGLRIVGPSHPTDWVSTSPVFYNQKTMMSTYKADRGITLNSERYVPGNAEIHIGNDVWIGENVTLNRGIMIGDGAILASNATVVNDVEPYTIVGGLPARKIRNRFSDKTIELLQRSQWWLYEPKDFEGTNPLDPEGFALQIFESATAGAITPYVPKPLKYENFHELSI